MSENKMDKIKIMEAMDVYLPDVDGVINCMHNYCLNLNEMSDVTAVVPKNKKGYKDNFPYKIKRCKSMHVPILNQYCALPKLDEKIKQFALNADFDIIHVHSMFGMGKFALRIAKKKNIPIVATFHSNMRPIFKDVTKSDFIAEKMVQKMGELYNECDEVFVCSPVVAEQCRSFGYKGKITYLPFGTDLKKCDNVDELSIKANQSFNLDKDELVLIYVGRVMKLKRIDFILKSLKLVKEKGIKFKFFVVGKGFEINDLKNLTKKLDLSEVVVFTGFLERSLFPQLLARADLLLFPSIYDNFGLVKVECAGYQTPGLFIKNSCAGFDVTDGVNGFLSDDDVESYACKICEAVEDRRKLKEIGKNASKDLYITWKECTDALLKRLTEIVEEKKNENKK